MNFKNEIDLLWGAVKSIKKIKLTREKVIFELISNGVAALVALVVYKLIHSFFKVDSDIKYKAKTIFTPRKIKVNEISESDFEWIMDWIGNPVIFIISIFVFSFVEQVMESYLNNRALNKK